MRSPSPIPGAPTNRRDALSIPQSGIDLLRALEDGPTSFQDLAAVLETVESILFIKGNRWIECGPLLFVRADGTGYLAFRTDTAGVVTEMHPGSFWSFKKLP